MDHQEKAGAPLMPAARVLLLLLLALPAAAWGQNFLQLADELYGRQDYYGAVPLYQEASKKSPDDKQTRYKLAVCYLKINSAESAVPLLKVLAADTSDTGRDSVRLLVQYFLGRSLYRDAEALLADAVARFPDDSGFRESLLSVYENLGSWDRALALLDTAVRKGADFERRRIRYLLKLKRTTEASNIIEQGLASPGNQDFWKELKAYFLRASGDTAAAERLYLGLFASGRNPAVLKECAMMYLERQDSRSASRVVLSTIAENDPPSWTAAAQLLKDLALYDDLIGLYLRMESKFPDQAFDRELIGLYELTSRHREIVERTVAYLRKTGDLDFAARRLSDLAVVQGQLALVTNMLGRSALSPETPEDLRSSLRMILYGIALRSDDRQAAAARAQEIVRSRRIPDFVLTAADDMTLKGWFDEASVLLADSVTNSPERKIAAACLIRSASIQYRTGKTARALASLAAVEAGYPGLYDRDAFATYRGLCLMAAERYAEAVEAFLSVSKKDGRLWLNASLCRLFLGSVDEALDLCRKARQDKAAADDAALLEADIRLSRGETAEALGILEDFVKGNPSSRAAVTALVEMFLVKNALSPEGGADRAKEYANARLLMFRGHDTEAAGVFQSLAAALPKFGYYFDYQSAMCYHNSIPSADAPGEAADRALALFRRCCDNARAPAYVRSHSLEMSGDIQRARGLNAEAADLYRKALTSDPQYSRQKELRMKLADLKKP
jgi:tetratricopeptide (TPR) repeat protein